MVLWRLCWCHLLDSNIFLSSSPDISNDNDYFAPPGGGCCKVLVLAWQKAGVAVAVAGTVSATASRESSIPQLQPSWSNCLQHWSGATSAGNRREQRSSSRERSVIVLWWCNGAQWSVLPVPVSVKQERDNRYTNVFYFNQTSSSTGAVFVVLTPHYLRDNVHSGSGSRSRAHHHYQRNDGLHDEHLIFWEY